MAFERKHFQTKGADIFSNGYYKQNRILMTLIGIWPESSILEKILVRSTVFVLTVSILTPQYTFLVRNRQNLNDILSGIIIQLIVIVGLTKYFFVVMNMKKVGVAIKRMREDWDVLNTSPSTKTIHVYAARGKLGSQFYMYSIFSAALLFTVAPLKQVFLDQLLPLNESRPKIFMLDTDYSIYGIDANELYFSTLIHSYFTAMIVMNMVVSVDAFILILVEHCCGLFESVGVLLKETAVADSSEDQYRMIRRSVILQQRAISSAEFIESSFTMMYGFAILVCALTISITGFETIIKIGDLAEVTRFGVFLLGQLVQVLFMSLPGQEILDHSIRVSENVYSCNWSNISADGKKLISIMLIRSMKPLRMTAGHYYLLNLENFGNVLRTSFSFFTVMLSSR